MNRIGTDVVALAAILGSAAVGGVVTLAAMEYGDGARTIVIAPKLHVRATQRCGVVVVDESVQVELDRALAELDESRAKLEQAYAQDLKQRLDEEMARLEKELSRLEDRAGR